MKIQDSSTAIEFAITGQQSNPVRPEHVQTVRDLSQATCSVGQRHRGKASSHAAFLPQFTILARKLSRYIRATRNQLDSSVGPIPIPSTGFKLTKSPGQLTSPLCQVVLTPLLLLERSPLPPYSLSGFNCRLSGASYFPPSKRRSFANRLLRKRNEGDRS
jgi:hypothetical protein